MIIEPLTASFGVIGPLTRFCDVAADAVLGRLGPMLYAINYDNKPGQ